MDHRHEPKSVPAELELRRARVSDRGFLRGLWIEAFGEYAFSSGGGLSQALSKSDCRVLVAAIGSKPVGFAVLAGIGRGTAHLEAIAVEERSRGQGVGRALLIGAEALARAHRAERIELVTAQANVAALALFLSSGYEIASRRAHYYPRGQDAARLGKRL